MDRWTRRSILRTSHPEVSVATFGGKLIDPLVAKDSFLRASPIFPQKGAKRPPGLQDMFPLLVAILELGPPVERLE